MWERIVRLVVEAMHRNIVVLAAKAMSGTHRTELAVTVRKLQSDVTGGSNKESKRFPMAHPAQMCRRQGQICLIETAESKSGARRATETAARAQAE